MNKRSASPRTLLWASEASAERRRRRGENVALAEAPQVERREAPHPYVTGGARAVATARGGPSQGSPGCLASTRRLPALHVPRPRGRRKKGKGRRPAPEQRSPRRR